MAFPKLPGWEAFKEGVSFQDVHLVWGQTLMCTAEVVVS